MSYRIGISLLVLLCSCSIQDPDPEPDPGAPAMGGAEETASPDSETLPGAARLIAEPVDSVEDVPGRYAQPFALPGQISTIRLGVPNFATGSYELFRSCGLPTCVPEAGQYHIVPTNPAIGFAALSLVDQTGTVRSTYLLDLLWRDGEGRLVAIQLRALVGNATGPTQVWWRLTDTDDDSTVPITTEPAEPPIASDASGVIAAAPRPALAGVFVRALPTYGDIGAVTLGEASWTENVASGTYQAAYPYCLPWCLGEGGDYTLELSNVATGTGRLTLVPTGNQTQAHEYAVYAIWRAANGAPAAIQLQRFDGVVPSGPVFTLYHQWWNTTATP